MYDVVRDLQFSRQAGEEMRRGGQLEAGCRCKGHVARWLKALAEELEIDVIRLRRTFGVLRVSRGRKEKT